jgi:hypothetical protein
MNEIQIWIYQIWNSNFVNDLKWKNSQDESCISQKVRKLCSWQVFILNSFRASKNDLHLVWYNISRMKNGYGRIWVCGAVVEEASCEGAGREFEPHRPCSGATLREKMRELRRGRVVAGRTDNHQHWDDLF